jgi:hypothetical protein
MSCTQSCPVDSKGARGADATPAAPAGITTENKSNMLLVGGPARISPPSDDENDDDFPDAAAEI